MNKSGGADGVGSPPRINTGRKLPVRPPGGSNTVATNAPEFRTDESRSAPEVQVDSSNLAYRREESGHQWDEGEFTPLTITSIALHGMDEVPPVYDHAYVFDPQAAGTTGSASTTIQLPSQQSEDEQVDLSAFLASMAGTSVAAKRQRFHTQGTQMGALNLKGKLPQTNNASRLQGKPPQTFVSGSVTPRGRSTVDKDAAHLRAEHAPVTPIGHNRSASQIDSRSVAQAKAPKIGETNALVAVSPEQKKANLSLALITQNRRQTTREGVKSPVPSKKNRLPALSPSAINLAHSANVLNLKMLESELREQEHVYDELREMYPYEAAPVEREQDKSQNS